MLDDAGLAAVRAASRELPVRAGDALFLEGDRSERVIVIDDGLMRVSALAPTGDELLVAFRGAGDILGEQSALDGGVHGQTVRAMTDASVWTLPVHMFLELVMAHPQVSLALHRVHVRRLREADEMRLEQATIDVMGRIARRLAALHTATGERDLDLSHQELATWVGASRESVTKGLASLRRRGLVTTSRGHIALIDPDALHEFAAV
jgi:CRP-like cAMP-binding protein